MHITSPTSDFCVEIPFVKHLGFVLTMCADGRSEIQFTPKPEHLNSYSVTHGGAVMSLLDVTMAMAARAGLAHTGVVTIEMKTSFMQPARIEPGALKGKGRLIHRTKSMAFTEAMIYDADGQLCAHATGTFKYVPRAVGLPGRPLSTD